MYFHDSMHTGSSGEQLPSEDDVRQMQARATLMLAAIAKGTDA